MIDPERHYSESVPGTEFPEADECEQEIRNVGWTLGNACPYKCNHCYSLTARRQGMDLTHSMIDRVISQLVGARGSYR